MQTRTLFSTGPTPPRSDVLAVAAPAAQSGENTDSGHGLGLMMSPGEVEGVGRPDIKRLRAQPKGATMVSVLLLSLAMMTVATLVLRSATRQTQQAGGEVARERALSAAHASVELAAAHYRHQIFRSNTEDEQLLSRALQGQNPADNPRYCQRDLDADVPDLDCIPGQGEGAPLTGQRNHLVKGATTDCSGRPCMRPGAVVMLPDASGTQTAWSRVPLSQLVDRGDAEALVTVWIRNNSSEALSAEQTGSWVADEDGRVVLTGMARIRNTTVAIEQEYYFKPAEDATPLIAPTPDEGYGGGHHGDNAAVAVCSDNYATATIGDRP